MPLETLAYCIAGYLGPDFTAADRRDIRDWTLHELHRQGVMVGHMCVQTLPEILAFIDSLIASELREAA